MSGVRSGTRLEQLQDLRRQISIQLEHARRHGTPTSDLDQLAAAVDDEIRTEGARRRRRIAHIANGTTPARPPASHRADLLMAALGVTTPVVRAWAVEHGLVDGVRRGRLPGAVVEAYAIHHQLDQITRKAGNTS